jgi:hypothetical protein
VVAIIQRQFDNPEKKLQTETVVRQKVEKMLADRRGFAQVNSNNLHNEVEAQLASYKREIEDTLVEEYNQYCRNRKVSGELVRKRRAELESQI